MEEFDAETRRQYLAEFDAQHLWATMNALSQLTQTTTVATFRAAFEDLMQGVTGISEPLLITFFTCGLRLEVRRELHRLPEPYTLREAFAQACACEARTTHSSTHSSSPSPSIHQLYEPPTQSPPPQPIILAGSPPSIYSSIPTPDPLPYSSLSLQIHPPLDHSSQEPPPDSPDQLDLEPYPQPSDLGPLPPSLSIPRARSSILFSNPIYPALGAPMKTINSSSSLLSILPSSTVPFPDLFPLSKPPPDPPDPYPCDKREDESVPKQDLDPKTLGLVWQDLTKDQNKKTSVYFRVTFDRIADLAEPLPFGAINQIDVVVNAGAKEIIQEEEFKETMNEDAFVLYQAMVDAGVSSSTTTCNSLAMGLCKKGRLCNASKLLDKMVQSGVCMNISAFTIFWDACCRLGAIDGATKCWNGMKIQWIKSNVITNTLLLSGWVRVRKIEYARKVFDEMPHERFAPFSTIICGFTSHDVYRESLLLFRDIQRSSIHPNSFILVALFIKVTAICVEDEGDSSVHNVVNQGVPDEVIEEIKIDLDEFFKFPLKEKEAFASLVVELDKQDYNLVITIGISLDLYACCGEKWRQFDKGDLIMFDISSTVSKIATSWMKGVVHSPGPVQRVDSFYTWSWAFKIDGTPFLVAGGSNVLICVINVGNEEIDKSSVGHGGAAEAQDVFTEMRANGVELDTATWLNVTNACASAGDLRKGRNVQGQVMELPVLNFHVTNYSKGGNSKFAKIISDRISKRSGMLCTAMILGYVYNGQPSERLDMLIRMRRLDNFVLESVILVGTITACSETTSFQACLSLDLLNRTQNSLVAAYGKCEHTAFVFKVFWEMISLDLKSWHVMITSQGRAEEALSGCIRFLEFNSQQMWACSIVSNSIRLLKFSHYCIGYRPLERCKRGLTHMVKAGLSQDPVMNVVWEMCFGHDNCEMGIKSDYVKDLITVTDQLDGVILLIYGDAGHNVVFFNKQNHFKDEKLHHLDELELVLFILQTLTTKVVFKQGVDPWLYKVYEFADAVDSFSPKTLRHVFIHWPGRPPEVATWIPFESVGKLGSTFHLEDKVDFQGKGVDTTLPVVKELYESVIFQFMSSCH